MVKRFVALGLIVTIGLTGCKSSEPTATRSPQPTQIVTRVIDGDTIEIGAVKIRLAGVDAYDLPKNCKALATARTKALVLDKPVEVEKAGNDHDRYGRLIRYIRVDGHDLGLTLIKEGLADAYYDGITPLNKRGKAIYPSQPRQISYHKADNKKPNVCGPLVRR